MDYRHEWKHEINQADLMVLRQRLSAVAKPDLHAVDGKYRIRSLYFDNAADKALREKLDGLSRREKFRIRYYNGDTSLIHLEKKSKLSSLESKQICAITKDQARAIAVGIVLAAGMIPLVVIGSVIIGVILLVFVNQKSHCNPYIVVLQCDGHDSECAAKAYLEEMTQRCVVKSKSAQKGSLELTMEARLKSDNTDFINVLAEMQGVGSAVLVSYNGDYMG